MSETQNKIEDISSEVIKLTKLEELILDTNSLKTPPSEIVSKGLPSIVNYFQQLEKKNNIDYVFVGKHERAHFEPDGLRKFDLEKDSFKLVTSSGRDKLYQVLK